MAEIVERYRTGDRSIAHVAKDFNLVESAVRRWVGQADIDEGQRDGLTSGDRAELQELRRENRGLQADLDPAHAGHGFKSARSGGGSLTGGPNQMMVGSTGGQIG
jgi:transposase-like protein